MTSAATFHGNYLLGALTNAEQERLFPALEWVVMPAGFVVYRVDGPQSHAFFPVDALVSLTAAPNDYIELGTYRWHR